MNMQVSTLGLLLCVPREQNQDSLSLSQVLLTMPEALVDTLTPLSSTKVCSSIPTSETPLSPRQQLTQDALEELRSEKRHKAQSVLVTDVPTLLLT